MALPRDPLATVAAALAEVGAGRPIVLRDDERTDQPADLVLAAELATADAINLVSAIAGGPTRVALPEDRCDALGLEALTTGGESSLRPGSTVPIDARGLSNGVSAADRARTVAVAIDPRTSADDLLRPGHVFPLRAARGGVLDHGRTADGAVDLVRHAGLTAAAVISEVLTPDGSVAHGAALAGHALRHGLTVLDTSDLIEYCRRHDPQVERVVTTPLPITAGEFTAVGYRSLHDDREHVALVRGEVEGRDDVLAHIHSGCIAGDVFHSLDCHCREHLVAAVERISRSGRGVIVHVSPGDEASRLLRHLPAADYPVHTTAREPRSRFAPDDEEIGRHILADLGVASARMLAGADDSAALEEAARVSLAPQASPSTADASVP